MSSRACPFPGLLPFQEEDAAFFFGRDRETTELLERLEQGRFVAVIGVSGSGKSSLVHAGLMPELRFADLPWRIVEIKPSGGPRRRLGAALEAVAPGPEWNELLGRSSYGLVDGIGKAGLNRREKLLIVVDQFEEIFSYRKLGHAEAEEADLFVQQLLRASAEPGVPVYVMLTMRTDYLGHCALFRNLAEALNEGTYLVPRLTRHEQDEAIRSPLAVSGVEIEQEVVDLLLNAAEANRDELPVLQHLLKRLWEEWVARGAAGKVGRADYERTGGWDEAIARDAEAVLEPLTAGECDAVKLVFQRITEKGTGERPVRAPASVAELSALTQSLVTPERLRAILTAFRERDLLVWANEKDRGRERIDIPHECVTWRWRQLAEWIEEEDRDARRLAFIAESARAGTPLAGSALEEALALRGRTADPWVRRYQLDAAELTQWIDHSEHEAARARRRTRNGVLALGVAALFFAVLGLWAWDQNRTVSVEKQRADSAAAVATLQRDSADDQRRQAELAMADADTARREALRQRDIAEAAERAAVELHTQALARFLASQAKANLAVNAQVKTRNWGEDLQLSLLLATESLRLTWTPEGYAAWARAVALAPRRPEAWFDVEGTTVLALDYHPGRGWFAFACDDGVVRIIERATGATIRTLPLADSLLSMSPINAAVTRFSPDGRWLAAAWDAIAVWDVATWNRRDLEGSTLYSFDMAFDQHSRFLAMGGEFHPLRVLETGTWRDATPMLRGDTLGVKSIAFTPTHAMIGMGTGELVFLQIGRDGRTLTEVLRVGDDLSGRLSYVAIGDDGGFARITDRFGLQVWGAFAGPALRARNWTHAAGNSVRLEALPAASWSADVSTASYIAFSPDDEYLLSGARSAGVGTVRVWDARRGDELARVASSGPALFVDDALVVGGREPALWQPDRGAVARLEHESVVEAVAFSPDGRWLATGLRDGTVQIRNTGMWTDIVALKLTEAATKRLPDGSIAGRIRSVGFTPDGRWLVARTGHTEDAGPMLHLVRAGTWQRLARREHEGEFTIYVSPDSRFIRTYTESAGKSTDAGTLRHPTRARRTRIWDIGTAEEVAWRFHQDTLRPRTRRSNIVVGTLPLGQYGDQKLLEAADAWPPLHGPLRSPDGHWEAKFSGTGLVLQATARNRLPVTLREEAIWLANETDVRADFSPDGRWLASAERMSVEIWLLGPAESLVEEACTRLSRNLTAEEWTTYIGGDPRPTCDRLRLPDRTVVRD